MLTYVWIYNISMQNLWLWASYNQQINCFLRQLYTKIINVCFSNNSYHHFCSFWAKIIIKNNLSLYQLGHNYHWYYALIDPYTFLYFWLVLCKKKLRTVRLEPEPSGSKAVVELSTLHSSNTTKSLTRFSLQFTF